MSGSFMRSFSCKGSGSISVTDQKGSGGSHSGPKPKARFDLRDMTEEEEGLSFAEYFKKRGLHHKLKKLIAKLGRKKKKEKRATTVVDTEVTEQPAGEGSGDGFEDELGFEEENGGGGGDATEEEEIVPVRSTSPMSSSPATPSSSATPSPGGSRRGRKPKYDSQGNRRPPRSLVGRTFFNC